MFSTDWRCFVLLLLRISSICDSLSICEETSENEINVIALINVHDETTNCTKLSLRGLQQMAVLEKTVGEINDKEAPAEGMHISLHVINTCCSNDELGVILKNLFTAHQACSHHSLLLGFIGPEKHLKSAQQMTSEYHKFHVVPFEPDQYVSLTMKNLLLYVGNRRLQLRSKIALSILNQLKWKAVYALVGENVPQNDVLKHILNEIEHVCVTGIKKIPTDPSEISSFYSTVKKEFEESEADGIIIFAENPSNIRSFLKTIDEEYAGNESPNPALVLYLYQVGLKSWELPRNFTVLLLQETSDMSTGFNLRPYRNQTLWNEYYTQYGLDYKRDAFDDIYDPSIAPFEYSLRLYWNAAKYAKKIKCSLGTPKTDSNVGMCYDMLHTDPVEWKSFFYKASYYHSISLRKITYGMNAPVVVKVYFVNSIVNFPQLIGRITDIGIMDMKMDLRTAIPKKSKSNLRKCFPPPSKKETFNPFPMDHESNWLAVFSKKMKNIIQLDGLVTRETNETINNAVSWFLGLIMFILGLILITKCVYTIFRVQTEEEREEARRRKRGRTVRVVST